MKLMNILIGLLLLNCAFSQQNWNERSVIAIANLTAETNESLNLDVSQASYRKVINSNNNIY